MSDKLKLRIEQHINNHPLEFEPYNDFLALCSQKEKTDFDTAHKWANELKGRISSALRKAVAEQNFTAAEDLDGLMFRTLVFNAPHFFDDYLQAVEYGKPYDKKFYQPRRHYLLRYVSAYQDLIDEKLDFLSVSMPKRSGKLIAHDCPVLTPNGFKPHGELKQGDYVYGISGKPVKVIYKHPDSYATYKVTFSSGEEILTSAEHEWFVYEKSSNQYKILETQQMLSAGLKCGRNNSRWKYIMPFIPPIVGEDKDLPVKPYSLGAWLGDGTTKKPLMTNDVKDFPIIAKMIKEGYFLHGFYLDKNYGTLVCTFDGLREDLQKVGMCRHYDKGNKHIPEVYFTASFRQRVELLSGLVDTDGYLEKGKHRIHISTIYPRLRDDIIRLVSTFGLDCRYITDKAKTSTSGIVGRHDVYTVSFAPDFELLTALERKHNTPTELPRRITIRKIEKLDNPVVGNCITVEGGVYRVGNRQILTHNSTLGIHFCNMLSGRQPNRSTLMEGTGDDLVKSFYNGCLEYLQQPNEYHFYDIFPESKLVQTNADTKIINLDKRSRFPTIMCRSIDSRQVGLSEATNLLYLDDCVEGREEAKNRQRLNDKWEVISGDIIGRAIEGTPIVICGTRYSIYDPIGRLQEEMKKQNKRMKIIEVPALDPVTDESNFEFTLEGRKIFTTQYFRDQRAMLSAEQWESEFQQQPFEAKGLLFPESSLNRYFELPVDTEPDSIVAVCDTAEKGEDYCSLVIGAIYGEEVYIVDVVFDDSPPEVTKPQCAKALIDNKVVSCTFESNAAGSYFAKDVQKILDDKGYPCSIKTKRTITNKQTRIEFASDNILRNFYFKDRSKYQPYSQYADFIRQVTTYTRSGKVDHDDAPDSLSLLENELRKTNKAKIEIFGRLF